MAARLTGDTRQQILDRARNLLQTRGVEGFSYRDISTSLGVKNAAVHYHFPSKNDLTQALIDEFASKVRRDIRTAREHSIPYREQIEAFFMRSIHEVRDGCRICPFGALVASFERLPEEIQQSVVKMRSEIDEWLTGVLEAGREQGVFRFDGPADRKALQIASAVQGARQMSMMMGKDVVNDVIDQLRMDLYTDGGKP